MRAGVDVTEVEAETKIRAKYLRAIENEEWDLLPGPVYAKSFLRAYGNYLGLDTRMLLDEFKRRHELPPEHERPSVGSLSRERERAARGPLLPSWALIGLVLVGILVALYAIGSLANTGKSSSPAPKTAKHPHPHPQARAPATPPPAPSTVNLQLVPTGDVYVCLVDGGGRRLINEQTFAAGDAIPSETGQKLLLTLGTANVQIKANGQPVHVAPSANAIRLLLTPTGVSHIPFSMSPTCP